MPEKRIKTYHWHNGTLMDGNTVAAGYTYSVNGKLEMCRWGMHASRCPLDALAYAPGNHISICESWGDVQEQSDKLVARNRAVLWTADAEDIPREFARWCALQVIHLWDAPKAVREYLETGDESKRAAAWAAAWAAARDAAWAAAWAAARDAAADAAWAAAWAVAWAAAWAAARDAARAEQSAKLRSMIAKLQEQTND
jgi:hypothetical protein